MSNTSKRYPLATADGKYIPLEVVRPIGVVSIAFNSITGSAPVLLPPEVEILTAVTSIDCLIMFHETGVACTTLIDRQLQADTQYLYTGILSIISPPAGKDYYSIIGAGTGIVILQFLESWKGLTLQSAVNRR